MQCGIVDNDAPPFFFADRVVLVRRENRDPLELLASRFGVTSHCRKILEHIGSRYSVIQGMYLYFWIA